MKMVLKKKENILTVFIIAVLMMNIFYVSAISGSMGNARMILYPEVNGWFTTTIEKTILVKNVNDVPINITLKTDVEGEKFLEIIDKSFILEPNTEKKAQFKVKVKKEGTYEGKINVFFSSVDSETNEAGVVLSSTIIVIAKKNQDYEEGNLDGETDNEDSNTDSGNIITGGAIGTGNKLGITILSISTLILLVALIGLVIYASKKRKLKSMVKEEGKSGKKLNGTSRKKEISQHP